MGSKILNIYPINIFYIFVGGKGNKRKNKQMGLHQTKKFMHCKGNHQQNEKRNQLTVLWELLNR